MENYEKYSNTEILLKRMINGDYIDKNEIDPLSYKLFKDTKVCTFLADGSIWCCNKKQAEYLIEEIRSKTDKGKREKEAVFHQRLKTAIEIAGAIIAIAVSILPFL
jgi:hypothetical protein